MSLGRMEAGLYNFQLPKSGDVSNVMTGIALIGAAVYGGGAASESEAAGAEEGISKPTPYNFYNVKNTRGIFIRVDEAPNRMPDLSSPIYNAAGERAMSRSGELLYSHYWDAPELGGMFRQSNHWGGMGTTNWSLMGPNGYVADPNNFHVINSLDQPVGFIKYSEFSPLH